MSDMRHILVVSRRYREKEARLADEKFNDVFYPCKITRIRFGSGIQGLPVCMIVFEDQPETINELEWVDHILRLRVRPGVVTIGWEW